MEDTHKKVNMKILSKEGFCAYFFFAWFVEEWNKKEDEVNYMEHMHDPTQVMEQPKKWLNFGWKAMAGYGIFWIALSIIVPIASYLTYPNQPMLVFGPVDIQFTGLSWDKIMAFSPDLGLWIVFSMVSMCAMMMVGGILTFMIARGPYRNGELWAWKALLIGHLVSNGFYVLIYLAHFSRGIYSIVPGASGLGADPVLLIALVWLYVGLWLPRKELHA